MTGCQDSMMRFTEAKIELYEIIENISKMAENNLETNKVKEEDFDTLIDLMRDTIGSAKYVVGFLKVIFDFNIAGSQLAVSPSKELSFAHGPVISDENENSEKDNYENEMDESTGSLYNSFEEIHFFETPKNVSKRKKGRELAASSSFEDTLNSSQENESLAVELFGAEKVFNIVCEDNYDDKSVIKNSTAELQDPGDPLIMSYADVCKNNAPTFETPFVAVENTNKWRSCSNDYDLSDIETTRDNLEDTSEPICSKEAVLSEFKNLSARDRNSLTGQGFAESSTGNENNAASSLINVESPSVEDLKSLAPGTPCLPFSARSSSSQRSRLDFSNSSEVSCNSYSDASFKDISNSKQQDTSQLTNISVEQIENDNEEPITTNLPEFSNSNQESHVNVDLMQDMKISRKLSILDQDKFLPEPISPIVNVEPKSPTIIAQQITPEPSPTVNTSPDIRSSKEPFTVIQDSYPDREGKNLSSTADDARVITPIQATNSTFISDPNIPAVNSTFDNSLLNYRDPNSSDSNLSLDVPLDRNTSCNVDDEHLDLAVRITTASTQAPLKTIIGKKSGRLDKKVNFTENSEVFYFPRAQGWISVPKEGGNTLGMEYRHFHSERRPIVDLDNCDISPNSSNILMDSLNENENNEQSRALRPRKSARLSMSSAVKAKMVAGADENSSKLNLSESESKEWKSMLKKPGVIKLTRVNESKSLPIISENDDNEFIEKSPEPVKSTRKCRNNRSFQVTQIFDNTLNTTAETSVLNTTKSVRTGELGTRGLERIPSRKRKTLLKSSGVEELDSREAEELKVLRENRGRVGCDCKGGCNPLVCICILEGIQCHQERPGSPCSCRDGVCSNPVGRYKFDPTVVQMHFIQTIMDTQGAFAIK